MGNLPSVQTEGEDMFDSELEKASRKQGVSDLSRETNLYDFSLLFNTDDLLKALIDIKDVDSASDLNKKKGELEQWLKNLGKRGETTISDVEFVDTACNKGVSKEEAMKFFAELDPDQQGTAEINFVIQMLKDRQGPPLSDMMIMPCPLLPGSLDTYIMAKPGGPSSLSPYYELGTDIVKFLRKYRVDPSHLPPYTISQLAGLFRSRERIIKGRYLIVKDKQIEGLEEMVEDSEYRVAISNCYSNVSTSTNEGACSNLTDGDLETYWQSNGSPRSHWIRVHMLPGIRLKELAVAVNSSDDSYMPKIMTVSVGNSPLHMREVKSHTIPREHNGRFVLLGSLAKEYSYIKVSICQCHSDGCDTRIRQIYVKGYKLSKEADQPTVLDGLVMWYLGLIASVSKAAMPVVPSLRNALLTQSKTALQHMPPLSLSRSSSSRPEFLTPVVLGEMETFIKSLCLGGDNAVSLDSESLSVLTTFCLATGNLNTILDCLLNLLDNVSLELPLGELIKKLYSIERWKYNVHATPLSLTLVKVDCKAEDGYAVDNIFNNVNPGSASFRSVKDVKVVNIILKEEKNVFKLVKVNIKVPSSGIAARAVLVFGFEDADVESEDFLAKFSEYDSWSLEEWDSLRKKEQDQLIQQRENGLMAYLEPNKSSKEFEAELSSFKPVKYLLFKFLGQESAEKVAIQSVSLKGYKLSPQLIEINSLLEEVDELCPLPPVGASLHYEGGQVLVKLLVFLCRMLHDLSLTQSLRAAAMLDPENLKESHICVDKFSLEKIWNLYIPLTLRSDEGLLNSCSLLCLIILRRGVQFLKTSPSSENMDVHVLEAEDGAIPETTCNSSIASAVLAHLCSLMDSSDTKPLIQNLARDIIREGVVVFFPGVKARKQYLLDMVDVILTGEQPTSWWLKFEALCSHFSQKDNNSLLELNWSVDKIEEINPDKILNILTTFLTMARKQALADLKSRNSSRPDDLVKLLCALQSSLLYWVQHLLSSSTKDDEKDSKILSGAKSVLSNYVEKVCDSCYIALSEVLGVENPEPALTALEKSIVGQTLPQLVAFLGTFFSENLPFADLLRTLNPLSKILNKICSLSPSIAPRLGSDELKCRGDDVVSVWTRESKHNYENNLKITEDFVCPTASKFVVEFDSRCHTERRYDYLTFTDSAGTKIQYDDTYGCDRWPKKSEFKGPKLTFYFYSDGSNNYWGYKFTVKAYGKSIPPLHWVYDLHISLARLFGQFVSSLISAQTATRPIKADKEEERKEEEALLKSDLWTTLFRGGFLVGKLTRSLSEAHATSPIDSTLSSMLFEIADGEDPSPLIDACRSAKPHPSYYGGPLVDKAIAAVFAALIWHSQEIREDLISNVVGESYKATPNVIDAFSAAEGLRRELVESRQRIVEAKEKEEDEAAKAKLDEDEPLVSCHEKALFLLKFAGLTRISYENARPSSPVSTRPSWGQKPGRFQRTVSTVEKIKQQISREAKPQTLAEKHPSFETILSFVRNTGLTVAKVQSLLQERAELARTISEGYDFATDYLVVMTAQCPPEIPVLSFLQHLLIHQRKFPRHYAFRVDGCGLELETKLRRSFQIFIQRLMDIIRSNQKAPRSIPAESGGQVEEDELEERVGVVRNVFTHLLDMCWQDYDLQLLRDLQLPDYLFETVINSSVTEKNEVVDKFEDEERMLEKYKLHMRFIEKWKEVTRFTQFLNSELAQEDLREANLFVVAMASNSEKNNRTRVNCDGCSNRIDGPWYRDTDIDEDCDICPRCFSDGSGNRPSSYSKEHVLLYVGHHLCHGCGMSIVTHRFQRKLDRCNFCMGCFRKESSTDIQWTVFLLTEQPATETCNAFRSSSEEHSRGLDYYNGVLTKLKEASDRVLYNRQHSWLLFSSLTLSMAQRLNQKEKMNPPYQLWACDLLLICLQLVVQGLKFSLSAAKDIHALKLKEMEDKKRKEAEDKQQEEKKVEEAEERSDRIQFDRDMTDNGGDKKRKEEDGETSPQEQQQEEGEAPVDEGMDGPIQSTSEEQQVGEHETKTSVDDIDFAVTEKTQRRPSPLQKQQALSETTPPNDGVTSSEKAFGLMFCDSMLGLLASVLPTELSLIPWISVNGKVEHVVGDTILPQLFRLAKSEEVNPANRLQAILVAIKYMSRVSPEVADHAVEVLEGVAETETLERRKTNGLKTVDYLFEMGANQLKESNTALAASMSECLLLLSRNPEWKPTVTKRITDTLSSTADTPNLSMVFGLLVLAGFPKLAKVGSNIKWSTGPNGEENHGVIVTPVTDSQVNIVNTKTRQRHSLKLSEIQVENTFQGCVSESKLPELISLIKNGIPKANKESPHQVEYRWILSLALKALNVLLRSSVKKQTIIESILAEKLLPLIVKLACKPTHFSKQWMLSDLEILGISSYKTAEEVEQMKKEKEANEDTSEEKEQTEQEEDVEKDKLDQAIGTVEEPHDKEEIVEEKEEGLGEDHVDGAQDKEGEKDVDKEEHDGGKEEEKGEEVEPGLVDKLEPDGRVLGEVKDEEKKNDQTKTPSKTPEGKKKVVVIVKPPPTSDSSPSKSKAELEEEAALRGLTDDIREMLKIMKDAFQCSLAAVRAMYEAAEEDMDKFIMSSDKYYDSESSGLKLPEEILEAAKEWMPFQRSSSFRDNTLEDYQEDQEDTGVTGFLAIPVDLKKMGAKPESESELKKSLELLPSSKDSKKKVKENDEREKSHILLQEQLKELVETQPDRDLMMKVNRAQVILHSREVLTSLLLYWPQEVPKISTTLLGGLEISQWFSLLDFLVKRLTQEERNKVLGRVVTCSEPTELVSLGLTAAQCMKEVTIDFETKEFKYQSQEETCTGKIVMPNAACMKITMEKSQSLNGSVELAADEEFTKHRWEGSGSGGKKKEEQEWNIPGNAVHYKVTLNKSEEQDQKKVWSFKVSGLQKGRFETSYSLLHILLGSPTATPTYEAPSTLLPIVKLWPNLIAAACELTGEQRIKVIGILLQLLLWNSSAQKVEGGGASAGSGTSQRLDLTMLKPLWSLYTTTSKEYDKGDKAYRLKPEILRALTELFLVVENTALDWRVEQDLLVETITEDNLRQLLEKGISNVAYVSLGLGLSNQVSEAFIEAKKNYVPLPPPVKDPPTRHSSTSSSPSSEDDDSSKSSSSTPSDSFDDSDYY